MLIQPIITTDRAAHVPTAFVELEWVLWHLINEFGIAAPGWERVIRAPSNR